MSHSIVATQKMKNKNVHMREGSCCLYVHMHARACTHTHTKSFQCCQHHLWGKLNVPLLF